MTEHKPVLLNEALYYLNVQPNKWYLDATFGGGGHSLAILNKRGNLIGLDWDKNNITNGRKRLVTACPSGVSYHLFHLNYQNLDQALAAVDLAGLDGILFDLGFSSDQLLAHRGFSFHHPEDVLDLRYDINSGRPAWRLLKEKTAQEIEEALLIYSQEPKARQISLVLSRKAREKKLQVKDVLATALLIKGKARRGQIHPATTIIQALRIMVNRELINLEKGLNKAVSYLRPRGRLVVISFHSGEDRIVKMFFRNNSQLSPLTPKAISPSVSERKINPRSRSAKLRAAEKK